MTREQFEVLMDLENEEYALEIGCDVVVDHIHKYTLKALRKTLAELPDALVKVMLEDYKFNMAIRCPLCIVEDTHPHLEELPF